MTGAVIGVLAIREGRQQKRDAASDAAAHVLLVEVNAREIEQMAREVVCPRLDSPQEPVGQCATSVVFSFSFP